MGYAVGYIDDRWVGYGVPAECDHPECREEINRGMAYQVNPDVRIYCCEKHRYDDDAVNFEPKPDIKEWVNHMLTDNSWGEWRKENPDELSKMMARLSDKESCYG